MPKICAKMVSKLLTPEQNESRITSKPHISHVKILVINQIYLSPKVDNNQDTGVKCRNIICFRTRKCGIWYAYIQRKILTDVEPIEDTCTKLRMYPNRRQPGFMIFKNLYDRLGETGSFRPKRDSACRPKTLNSEQEEEILVRVAENSELSTRHIAMETGVSKSTVWKLLKKEGLHPYHFMPVQNLIQGDFPDRLDFAHFCRLQQIADPIFLNKVLFTDEATFTRRGVFNMRGI
ncbi:hypothetical protein NQ318_006703 [Aromia moschata]|uniref:Transposase n=1 Tax=Aromia moschata TaxID=1265417 RepID=A0AAV8YT93_9CUCU|nr:hypothetical protein NQ318_006703 [Aromia moschata]